MNQSKNGCSSVLSIHQTIRGAYMDLDIININGLDGLGRMLAKEDSGKINNAAFQFPAKDEFVWDMMEEFVRKFNGMIW